MPIVKIATEQLSHVPTPAQPDRLSASAKYSSLRDELRNLVPLREPGRCFEYRLVGVQVWTDDSLPESLRLSATVMFSDETDDTLVAELRNTSASRERDQRLSMTGWPANFRDALQDLDLSEDGHAALIAFANGWRSYVEPEVAYSRVRAGTLHHPSDETIRGSFVDTAVIANKVEDAGLLLEGLA
jgi:hypothetical protein